MQTPIIKADLHDLPDNSETLQNAVILLYGAIGSLTLENAILRQQLHKADTVLATIETQADQATTRFR